MSYIAAQEKLIKRIKHSPDRKWITNYLDLMRQLVITTGLKNDDSRLTMSIPGKSTDRPFLPVSINYRYVLASDWVKDSLMISFIFGAEYQRMPEVMAKTICRSRFEPHPGEIAAGTPYWLNMDIEEFIEAEDVRFGWLRAVMEELGRAEGSPYRKYHNPLVYDVVVFKDYREMILDRAFPEER